MSQSSGSPGSSNPHTSSQPSTPAAASNPHTSSQPSTPAAASNPHTPVQSSSASSMTASQSQTSTKKIDKIDHNIRYTALIGLIGAILGAIIVGVFQIVAAATPPLIQSLNPTQTPTLVPTVTPIPTPTPLPPTPTPVFQDESILNEYLSALESQDFETAVGFLSEYSLFAYNKRPEDIISEFRSERERGIIYIKHSVVGREVLQSDETIMLSEETFLFRVVVTLEESNGDEKVEERQYALRKDLNGEIRVNYGDLIDFQYVQGNEAFSPSNKMSIQPFQVVRLQHSLRVSVSVSTFETTNYQREDGPATCSFADGSSWEGEVRDWPNNSYGMILVFNGFHKSYPISCVLPYLKTGGVKWDSPRFEIVYQKK